MTQSSEWSSSRARAPERSRASLAARLGGLAALAVVASIGCDSRETPRADATRETDAAVARIEPTQGSQAHGTVEFRPSGDGVEIHADLSGLPEGRHGFHVHQNGDCSAPDASSAGPHFAFEVEPGAPDRITGNLGELVADSSGHAVLDADVPRAELEGDRSIVGRAVVVHARGNDPTVTPSGDAGARIACGVIVASRDRSSPQS